MQKSKYNPLNTSSDSITNSSSNACENTIHSSLHNCHISKSKSITKSDISISSEDDEYTRGELSLTSSSHTNTPFTMTPYSDSPPRNNNLTNNGNNGNNGLSNSPGKNNTYISFNIHGPVRNDPYINRCPRTAILRPLKGLDMNLEQNLESCFLQDYPNFEIILCVADGMDPACTLAHKLSIKYPHVQCTILVGNNHFGLNPKVNNLVKGYNHADAEIIWILDSNICVDPGVLKRAVEIFQKNPRVGLVHHTPCAVGLSSFGAYLDGSFLNCTHARMYTVINSFGVASCIIGKSNLFRKADMEQMGGLAQFSKYISEDNMIGVGLMNIGKTHQIAPDFAYQSIGNVTVTNFLSRRVRWLRVRKYAVTAATIYEPFSECLLCGFLAALSFKYFYGIDFFLFTLFHWIVWFSSDMLVAKFSYYSRKGGEDGWVDFSRFAMGWLALQILVLPSYIWAMAGNEIRWRDQIFVLKTDGTVFEPKKIT